MQVLPSLTPSALLAGATGTGKTPAPAGAGAGAGAGATAARVTAPLTTISQHIRSISTTEGLRSLWRGVASVIMGAGPAHAAHFGMYEFVREISGGRGEGWWGVGGTGQSLPLLFSTWTSTVLIVALAGATATISSDALMNPFDG